MDNNLIAKIVELTGASEEVIQEFLDGLSLDQNYDIIDANVRKNDAKLAQLVSGLKAEPDNNKVEEAMRKDKNKGPITVQVPKPRDPMARELAKGQYQPKRTPNKKEQLAKKDSKHKGNRFESQDVMESLMGMSSIPAIKKMLTLAGRPNDDDSVKKAMEDYMSDITGVSPLDAMAFPTGTTIKPGLISGMGDDMDDADDLEFNTDFDDDLDLMSDGELDSELTQSQDPYVDICQSFATIKANLPNITMAEYIQARKLLSELMSAMDLLGNGAAGQ